LTIARFTLTADTASPELETPFHLIVTVRTSQRVSALANIDLPILSELELLGDERQVTRDAQGTTYREVIGVVAHHTGDIRIAPATLDAIDARDGKAKRYFSNDLTVHVAGGALQPLHDAGGIIGAVVRGALLVVFWLGCILAAIAVVVLLFRRRPPVDAAAPVAPHINVMPVARDPRDVLHDGLLTLRAERSRTAALAVRSLARHLVGATDTETLADVLRRPGASSGPMHDVLRSLERAAFTYDTDFSAAVEAAIAALEHATA
jgi:hypothetical protein